MKANPFKISIFSAIILFAASASTLLAGCSDHGNDHGHDHAKHNGSQHTHSATETVFDAEVPAAAISAYLHIQKALADDSMDGVSEQAKKLEDLGVPGAGEIAKADDIEGVRAHFKTVSNHYVEGVRQHGAETESLRLAHCPMAFDNEGAAWLQSEGTISNPYFGARMLRCGNFQEL
ncbi:MAG: DUF3347 domain-containing protein [Opitutales bacterium]|nr:DUF3347 domain-containing protein [Opitutales bacterium]